MYGELHRKFFRSKYLEITVVRPRRKELRVARQVDRHDLPTVRRQRAQQLPIVRTPDLDEPVVARARKVQSRAVPPFLFGEVHAVRLWFALVVGLVLGAVHLDIGR